MLKITRTNTHHHIVFTTDSTRWRFAKGDYSKLQEVFELLYAYQCTGLEPQQVKEALLNLHTANKTIWDLRSKKPRWIPVAERLPEIGCNVLVIDRVTGEVTTAHLNDFNGFVFEDGRGHGVTHWMPLPAPPQ